MCCLSISISISISVSVSVSVSISISISTLTAILTLERHTYQQTVTAKVCGKRNLWCVCARAWAHGGALHNFRIYRYTCVDHMCIARVCNCVCVEMTKNQKISCPPSSNTALLYSVTVEPAARLVMIFSEGGGYVLRDALTFHPPELFTYISFSRMRCERGPLELRCVISWYAYINANTNSLSFSHNALCLTMKLCGAVLALTQALKRHPNCPQVVGLAFAC